MAIPVEQLNIVREHMASTADQVVDDEQRKLMQDFADAKRETDEISGEYDNANQDVIDASATIEYNEFQQDEIREELEEIHHDERPDELQLDRINSLNLNLNNLKHTRTGLDSNMVQLKNEVVRTKGLFQSIFSTEKTMFNNLNPGQADTIYENGILTDDEEYRISRADSFEQLYDTEEAAIDAHHSTNRMRLNASETYERIGNEQKESFEQSLADWTASSQEIVDDPIEEKGYVSWDAAPEQMPESPGYMESKIMLQVEPKQKHAYRGNFNGYLSVLNWLIKSMDRPKIDIESVTQMRNNVLRNYPVKYNFGDLSITFWDDVNNTTVTSLDNYFQNKVWTHPSNKRGAGLMLLRDTTVVPEFSIDDLVVEGKDILRYTFFNAVLSSLDYDSNDDDDEGTHVVQAVFKIEGYSVTELPPEDSFAFG
jgi:hypothetical protein